MVLLLGKLRFVLPTLTYAVFDGVTPFHPTFDENVGVEEDAKSFLEQNYPAYYQPDWYTSTGYLNILWRVKPVEGNGRELENRDGRQLENRPKEDVYNAENVIQNAISEEEAVQDSTEKEAITVGKGNTNTSILKTTSHSAPSAVQSSTSQMTAAKPAYQSVEMRDVNKGEVKKTDVNTDITKEDYSTTMNQYDKEEKDDLSFLSSTNSETIIRDQRTVHTALELRQRVELRVKGRSLEKICKDPWSRIIYNPTTSIPLKKYIVATKETEALPVDQQVVENNPDTLYRPTYVPPMTVPLCKDSSKEGREDKIEVLNQESFKEAQVDGGDQVHEGDQSDNKSDSRSDTKSDINSNNQSNTFLENENSNTYWEDAKIGSTSVADREKSGRSYVEVERFEQGEDSTAQQKPFKKQEANTKSPTFLKQKKFSSSSCCGSVRGDGDNDGGESGEYHTQIVQIWLYPSTVMKMTAMIHGHETAARVGWNLAGVEFNHQEIMVGVDVFDFGKKGIGWGSRFYRATTYSKRNPGFFALVEMDHLYLDRWEADVFGEVDFAGIGRGMGGTLPPSHDNNLSSFAESVDSKPNPASEPSENVVSNPVFSVTEDHAEDLLENNGENYKKDILEAIRKKKAEVMQAERDDKDFDGNIEAENKSDLNEDLQLAELIKKGKTKIVDLTDDDFLKLSTSTTAVVEIIARNPENLRKKYAQYYRQRHRIKMLPHLQSIIKPGRNPVDLAYVKAFSEGVGRSIEGGSTSFIGSSIDDVESILSSFRWPISTDDPAGPYRDNTENPTANAFNPFLFEVPPVILKLHSLLVSNSDTERLETLLNEILITGYNPPPPLSWPLYDPFGLVESRGAAAEESREAAEAQAESPSVADSTSGSNVKPQSGSAVSVGAEADAPLSMSNLGSNAVLNLDVASPIESLDNMRADKSAVHRSNDKGDCGRDCVNCGKDCGEKTRKVAHAVYEEGKRTRNSNSFLEKKNKPARLEVGKDTSGPEYNIGVTWLLNFNLYTIIGRQYHYGQYRLIEFNCQTFAEDFLHYLFPQRGKRFQKTRFQTVFAWILQRPVNMVMAVNRLKQRVFRRSPAQPPASQLDSKAGVSAPKSDLMAKSTDGKRQQENCCDGNQKARDKFNGSSGKDDKDTVGKDALVKDAALMIGKDSDGKQPAGEDAVLESEDGGKKETGKAGEKPSSGFTGSSTTDDNHHKSFLQSYHFDQDGSESVLQYVDDHREKFFLESSGDNHDQYDQDISGNTNNIFEEGEDDTKDENVEENMSENTNKRRSVAGFLGRSTKRQFVGTDGD